MYLQVYFYEILMYTCMIIFKRLLVPIVLCDNDVPIKAIHLPPITWAKKIFSNLFRILAQSI